MRLKLLAAFVAVVLAALAAGCTAPGDQTDADAGSGPIASATAAFPPVTWVPYDADPNVSGTQEAPPQVFLVPLRDFPDETVEELREYFAQRHGIRTGVLPRVQIDESHADRDREQVIADRAVEAIVAERPADGSAPVIIGLTQYDIYMQDEPQWAFVFSMRDNIEQVAVVSTARMDPQAFGEPADDDLLFRRAAKMVGKNIGVMYMGLPMSSDPSSVMYDRLVSLDALDTVADDFTLAP